MADGYAAYGNQFAVQNDGLLSTSIWSTEVSYAYELTTGYQTVSAFGQRAAGGFNTRHQWPCRISGALPARFDHTFTAERDHRDSR